MLAVSAVVVAVMQLLRRVVESVVVTDEIFRCQVVCVGRQG